MKIKGLQPKVTMRTFRLFKEKAGYDLLTDQNRFQTLDVLVFLWCALVCGAMSSEKAFDLSPEELENEIEPRQMGEISAWFTQEMRALGDPDATADDNAKKKG